MLIYFSIGELTKKLMNVYVEYVFIDNFVIDYLIFKLTFYISGVNYKRWQVVLCSILGGIFALLYPLLSVNSTLLSIIKVLFGIFLVSISANYKSIKEFYISAIIFFSLTFFMGGAVSGIFSLFNIPIEELSIALMILPCYIISKIIYSLVHYFFKRKDIAQYIFMVELKIFNSVYKLRGFLDTGNGVYSGKSPVIFCEKQLFQKLLRDANGENLKEIKHINIQTITSEKKFLSIKLSSLTIIFKDKLNIYNNVTLAVSDKSIGSGYDIILHPALLEVDKNDVTYSKTEKVS